MQIGSRRSIVDLKTVEPRRSLCASEGEPLQVPIRFHQETSFWYVVWSKVILILVLLIKPLLCEYSRAVLREVEIYSDEVDR